jgi:hypothetical protein
MIAGSAAATPDRRANAQVAPARDFIKLMGVLPVDKHKSRPVRRFPGRGRVLD